MKTTWTPNEHQRAWLDALRGGEFLQGRDHMKRVVTAEDGTETAYYCCLGVACELVGVTWMDSNYDLGLDETSYGWVGEHHDIPVHGYMPRWLCDFLDIDHLDEGGMVRANDSRRLTFLEIADLLERMWETGTRFDPTLEVNGS